MLSFKALVDEKCSHTISQMLMQSKKHILKKIWDKMSVFKGQGVVSHKDGSLLLVSHVLNEHFFFWDS